MSIIKIAREKATDNLLDNLLDGIEFTGTLPASVCCCKCLKVLNRPLQLSCGHRCCKKCEAELIPKEGTKVCPVDGEPVEYQFPDVSALTEIMLLQCCCTRKEDGCDWQGQLLELEDHLKICLYRADIPCGWHFVDCKFVGSKKELEKHLIKDSGKHNFLFATYLSDVVGSLSMSKSNMRELKNMTQNLKSKLGETDDSILATQEALNETLSYLKGKGLNTVDLKQWLFQVESKLDSLKRQNNVISHTEFNDLVYKVELQHRKLNELLRNRPDKGALLESKKAIEDKLTHLQSNSKQHHAQLSDSDLKIRLFQSASFDGHYIWKLDNLKNRMLGTSNKTIIELYTPPLHTASFGYKFSAKVLLYGDPEDRVEGISSVDYVALYIVIMKGDFDEILKFPFPHPITITLRNLSGKSNIVHEIIPDNKKHFQRPLDDMNPAVGFPKFCTHDTLYSEGFVKDDAIYVEIKVDKNTTA